MIAPAPRRADVDDDVLERAVVDAMTGGATARDAAATVARDLGVARRRAYDMALRVRATS